MPREPRISVWFFMLLALCLPLACTPQAEAPPALVVYGWEDELTSSTMADFTAATGIQVEIANYASTEEAVENLRAGKQYDVVVMENRFIASLANEKLLAPLDLRLIPNFRNIPLNFRDLMYDPGNRYSIPYTWGTTGLLVRTDLVTQPVERWADLWDPAYSGKVAIWRGQGREEIALALKTLGFSANEESPAALKAVAAKLLELQPSVLFIEDDNMVSAAPLLASGAAVMAVGYSRDILEGRKLNPAIDYVLPQEGALLWGDNFVIPASSSQSKEAAALINYLLDGKVAAGLIERNFYASANDAALAQLKPALAQNPVLFPPQEVMQNIEIVMPLSVEGEKQYAQIWAAFLAAGE